MVVRHQQDLGGGRGGDIRHDSEFTDWSKKGGGVTLNEMGDWKRQE